MGRRKAGKAIGGITMLLGLVLLSSGLLFSFAIPAEPHVVYERDITATTGSVTFDEVNDPANIIGVLVQTSGCQSGNDGLVIVAIGDSGSIGVDLVNGGEQFTIANADFIGGQAGRPCAFLYYKDKGSDPAPTQHYATVQDGFNPAGLSSATISYLVQTNPTSAWAANAGTYQMNSGKIKLYVREADKALGLEPDEPTGTEEREAPSPENGKCVDEDNQAVSCAPNVPLDEVGGAGKGKMASWIAGAIVTLIGGAILLWSAFRK